MSHSQIEVRRPWVALLLSLLSPGVGHLYCGKIAKGLVLYVAWFLVPALAFVGAMLPASLFTLVVFLLLPALSMFVVYIYSAWNACFVAKRAPQDFQKQEYNRAALYCFLILVHLACPILLMSQIREFVFEGFSITTSSMSPSILEGDRILVNKLLARHKFPNRGDIIIFHNPEPTGGEIFIKRVVAVVGDKVVIQGERIEINGQELPRNRIPAESLRGIQNQVSGKAYYESNAGRRYKVVYGEMEKKKEKRFEIIVPARNVFVLGDNRNHSLDSRHFGTIHVGEVIGYVQYIYAPAETWSRFGVYQD